MGFSGSLGGSAFGGAYSGTAVNRYDSGLHRAQRSEIRQILVDRLGALLFSNGRYLRSIRQLPRPLKGDSPEEIDLIVNELQGQSPAVLVAIGRKTYQAAGMEIPAVSYRGELELAVYVVCTNARARQDGRLSTDIAGQSDPLADPGIETVLEHIEELLLGQELNIKSVSELRPVSEDELATFGDLSIWEQRYTLAVERVMNPERDNGEALTAIEGKNNFTADEGDDANPVVDTTADLEHS